MLKNWLWSLGRRELEGEEKKGDIVRCRVCKEDEMGRLGR